MASVAGCRWHRWSHEMKATKIIRSGWGPMWGMATFEIWHFHTFSLSNIWLAFTQVWWICESTYTTYRALFGTKQFRLKKQDPIFFRRKKPHTAATTTKTPQGLCLFLSGQDHPFSVGNVVLLGCRVTRLLKHLLMGLLTRGKRVSMIASQGSMAA